MLKFFEFIKILKAIGNCIQIQMSQNLDESTCFWGWSIYFVHDKG